MKQADAQVELKVYGSIPSSATWNYPLLFLWLKIHFQSNQFSPSIGSLKTPRFTMTEGLCDHILNRLFWSLRKYYYICTVKQASISTCLDRKEYIARLTGVSFGVIQKLWTKKKWSQNPWFTTCDIFLQLFWQLRDFFVSLPTRVIRLC